MDVLELRGGVDAELVGQPGPQPLVGPESVGLAPGQGEGAEQLAAEPLRQRMGGHQRLQLGHQPVGGSGGQGVLDPVLQGPQAQVVQPGHGRSGEGGRGHLGQGRSPPQGQGLAQQLPGPVRVAAQRRPAGQGQGQGQGQGLEADRVHRLGGDGQPVAALGGLDHAGDLAAQARHERLEGVGRPGRRVLVPDRVDQLAWGHHPPGVEGQAHQQPAQPCPGHLDGRAGAGPHLQRAQDGDAHVGGHATDLLNPGRSPGLQPVGSRVPAGRSTNAAAAQVGLAREWLCGPAGTRPGVAPQRTVPAQSRSALPVPSVGPRERCPHAGDDRRRSPQGLPHRRRPR